MSLAVESSSIVRVTNVMHCNVMAKYMQSNAVAGDFKYVSSQEHLPGRVLITKRRLNTWVDRHAH